MCYRVWESELMIEMLLSFYSVEDLVEVGDYEFIKLLNYLIDYF